MCRLDGGVQSREGFFQEPDAVRALQQDNRATLRRVKRNHPQLLLPSYLTTLMYLPLFSQQETHSIRTPLLMAAQSLDEATVKLLLETEGVGVDPRNKTGDTPLSLAVTQGNEEIVRLLIETGKVDLNVIPSQSKETPLYTAVRMGFVKIAMLLLASGKTDVKLRSGEDEKTRLEIALEKRNKLMVRTSDRGFRARTVLKTGEQIIRGSKQAASGIERTAEEMQLAAQGILEAEQYDRGGRRLGMCVKRPTKSA
ncbi:ankyrin [Rhizodiscina lignyota]|uniref:Ankyrin n=1 Tax=Rhizodiscina lignyota TaxID=1504668 RepID=A0A9P4IE12_9PEZI|nr:ankyrin [Rhizodiscina lignyota]